MPSKFDQQHLGQQITNILGETLSDVDLQNCLATVEIVEPSVAKEFWYAADATPGIYLVLAGKVRLLDHAENLITTLCVGSSFGEVTLFGCEDFQPYAARASASLKLCYLKLEALQPLIDKYPSIHDRLLVRAQLWDLVLLCQQNSQIPGNSSDVERMLNALSVFERHYIEIGGEISPPKDTKLWLLRQGQLLNSEGDSLTPGKIAANPQQSSWRATQPTIAYILRDADWQTALLNLPQLMEFVDPSDRPSVILNYQVPHPPKSSQNVIPFPKQDSTLKQKKKKSHPYFPSPKIKVGHWWGHLTKSYPFFAQQSASDCGVACLVMIGRYWGKRLSTNHLRDIANVNRSGVSLRSLAAAAENIGFSTRPVKASLDKLTQQPLPAIAHWEGKHYIVVYEITKTHVIVGDPAIGQRRLTQSEFLADWTGYALLLQPTALLKDASEESAGFWKFFEIIKPHSKVLAEVFIASVLIQVFGLVTPLLTQVLLDRVIVQGSTMTLNAVGLALVIFGFFRIFMSGVRQYLLDHTANRVSISLLVGFIKHTFRLPLSYFESRYVGDIVSRIQENHKIQRFLTGDALSVILDLLTLVIYLGLMFSYSWQMTLLVLLIVPPFFILAFASTSILRRVSREIFNAGAEENSYLIQSLTGIRSVRSMAIEQSVRWHWEELLHKLVKKGFSGQVISNRLQIISGSIQTLMNTGLLWFGAWQVIHNQLTIGQLVAFNMLMGNVISPFQRLAVLWNQLQEIIISAERINDVLEAEPEEDLQNKPRQSLRKLQGRIRFEHVTFRYHPESDRNVLENISFEIQPEQTVAVVGRSGSGKTTLSKLILGLYSPTEGRVLIDGYDVTNVSLRSLRSQIGVVDQDTFLFGGTVQENISIAHPEATQEEIITAAHQAGADEFIRQLPMNYQTQIGEGGGMLSGGQRQRLAIARALLGNPRFIIFDEATSHLDSESERIIQNNLKTILKGRTSLIIAHRLSTVRNADLVLVLDRGVLVESGTHDELIAKKGHYFYLNQQQLAQAS
ncbi:MAG: peptidase domain-containing ABC transporter [Stigonema ocellatum SAG 48.90 = DSM 106950]|nr:peptidase domain-containing ABC transporter [Stigonema ocellatum SAG 48.90 = DSM 106950]